MTLPPYRAVVIRTRLGRGPFFCRYGLRRGLFHSRARGRHSHRCSHTTVFERRRFGGQRHEYCKHPLPHHRLLAWSMQSSPGELAMFGLHSWWSLLSANSMIHSAVRAAFESHEITGRLGRGSGRGATDEDAHAPTAKATTRAARVFRSTCIVEPFSVR